MLNGQEPEAQIYGAHVHLVGGTVRTVSRGGSGLLGLTSFIHVAVPTCYTRQGGPGSMAPRVGELNVIDPRTLNRIAGEGSGVKERDREICT